jgi:hypothetical protein
LPKIGFCGETPILWEKIVFFGKKSKSIHQKKLIFSQKNQFLPKKINFFPKKSIFSQKKSIFSQKNRIFDYTIIFFFNYRHPANFVIIFKNRFQLQNINLNFSACIQALWCDRYVESDSNFECKLCVNSFETTADLLKHCDNYHESMVMFYNTSSFKIKLLF